nr:sigma-70 family RNA polymerase sigma factor [Microbacterium sp. CFH 90308]
MLRDTAPRLLGYFLNRIDVAEDAADLVNETLIAALKSARRAPSEPEPARMWLFGIARNTLRHHYRSTARRDALTRRLTEALHDSRSELDDVHDVRAAVAALPEQLAELIRLVHWDGFSIEQAAAHTGINPSTARSRHARAKELLRQHLEPTRVAETRRAP